MPKYTTKNWCEGGYWNLDDSVTNSSEVIIEDKDYFSGLYDAEGRPLYREPNKIGFI